MQAYGSYRKLGSIPVNLTSLTSPIDPGAFADLTLTGRKNYTIRLRMVHFIPVLLLFLAQGHASQGITSRASLAQTWMECQLLLHETAEDPAQNLLEAKSSLPAWQNPAEITSVFVAHDELAFGQVLCSRAGPLSF